MNKVVIKIIQGNVLTQTVLDGLTINPPVAISYSICMGKNYGSRLAAYKVIAIMTLLFGGHRVFTYTDDLELPAVQ